MIPPIFHRIWVGDNPVPDEYVAYGESWLRLHPGWEMRLWTDDNLPELRRPESADRRRVPAERADLLRLEILSLFGGIYVDMDFECRKPIDELIDGLDFFIGYVVEDRFGGQVNRRVSNAIMGATPGHEIVHRAMEEARPRADFTYDKAAAGPVLLDRVLEGFPQATIFPVEYLYPQTEEQEVDAYAVHHEDRSWLSREELNDRIKSLHQKLRKVRERAHRLKKEERRSRHDLAKVRAKLERSERRRRELKDELAAARQGVGQRALARISRSRRQRGAR